MIVDPMLATGGSAAAAVQLLAGAGCEARCACSRSSPRPRASRRSCAARQGREGVHRRGGQPPQRARLHRARPRRRRRPPLRHAVAKDTGHMQRPSWDEYFMTIARRGRDAFDLPAPPLRRGHRQGPPHPGDRLQRDAEGPSPLRGGRLPAREARHRVGLAPRAVPRHPRRAERGRAGRAVRRRDRRRDDLLDATSPACCARRSSSTQGSPRSCTATPTRTSSPRRCSPSPAS